MQVADTFALANKALSVLDNKPAVRSSERSDERAYAFE